MLLFVSHWMSDRTYKLSTSQLKSINQVLVVLSSVTPTVEPLQTTETETYQFSWSGRRVGSWLSRYHETMCEASEQRQALCDNKYLRTLQGSHHNWISSLSWYKPLKTIMVIIFNTVQRSFFGGAKELKEEGGQGSQKN